MRFEAAELCADLKASLGNPPPCGLDALAEPARTRLERMQYRRGLLDGFIAGTGLITTPP
ncbi:hypothetical protein QUY26_37775 [Streptomyces flavofungini]|nr:hypothetical protein [Streptomyces flavofungini]WJV50753.1 hypothetical protein QUY26_37775 [Streptomyces flavofungini]